MKTPFRRSTTFFLVIVSAVTIFFSGCSFFNDVITSNPIKTSSHVITTPPSTPQLEPIPIGQEILYKEDFSNSKSGWLTGAYDSGDFYYEGGEYSLLSIKENYYIYALSAKSVADFAIEVDSRALSLGKNGYYGIVFRHQGEGTSSNFYMFSINDGSFQLVLRYGGQWQTIQSWKESSYIRTSPNTNRLRAACLGSRIDVYANGHLLGSYIDKSLASGYFGVEVGQANTHVHFDNIIAYTTTAPEITSDITHLSSDTVPESAKKYYSKAGELRKAGDYFTSIEYYKLAIQEYYTYYEAWYEQGEVLIETGKYDEALNCYFTATEISPESSDAWVNEGVCLENLGRNNEAMSAYNEALEKDPDNPQALKNKNNLINRGVPDNKNAPPVKQYDNTHPLKVSGPIMVITLNEGEPFSTSMSVSGGQPPYHWFLVTTNGVADNVAITPDGANGDTVTITGTAANIEPDSTTAREAVIEVMVEDSSDYTRRAEGSFWLHVNNKDDSAIAAQVAREWYDTNYGDLNATLQQAMAGVGFASSTGSFSNPSRLRDGTYQVTITLSATAAAEGVSVSAEMDVILTIDTKTRSVINVTSGDVRVNY